MLFKHQRIRRELIAALPVFVLSWCFLRSDSEASFFKHSRPDFSQIQKSLQLPVELGMVTDAFLRGAQLPPDFILIQDLHNDPLAQRRIAAILIHGYYDWGIRKVFVEGAFGPVDICRFLAIPEGKRRWLLEQLLRQGLLTGVELAAVTLADSDKEGPYRSPFQLVGAEDPRVYEQDFEMFERVQAGRERALRDLEWLRSLQPQSDSPPDSLEVEQLERIRLLVQLKLTPQEYQDYLDARKLIPALPGISPVIQAAEEFYRLARLRSWILLDEASRKLPAWRGPRVIVAGGFHTRDMTDVLRQEGKSFIVIDPCHIQGVNIKLTRR